VACHLIGWTITTLIKQLNDERRKMKPKPLPPLTEEAQIAIRSFLQRVYYELRNFGVTPEDRSLNFAVTNLFQLGQVFFDAVQRGLKLDSITTERSPICRPNSDCWDVKLTFFDPAKTSTVARHVYRFGTDVSDVIPVTVGEMRNWELY